MSHYSLNNVRRIDSGRHSARWEDVFPRRHLPGLKSRHPLDLTLDATACPLGGNGSIQSSS